MIVTLAGLAIGSEPDCQNCLLMARSIDRILVTDPTAIGGEKEIFSTFGTRTQIICC